MFKNEDFVWLGQKWLQANNFRSPTKRDIVEGLMMELNKFYSPIRPGETSMERKEILKQMTVAFETLL